MQVKEFAPKYVQNSALFDGFDGQNCVLSVSLSFAKDRFDVTAAFEAKRDVTKNDRLRKVR